jgi:hypothetical protein
MFLNLKGMITFFTQIKPGDNGIMEPYSIAGTCATHFRDI